MGLFDTVIDTVEGWFGTNEPKHDAPAAAAPAGPQKDPGHDLALQRAIQDQQGAQMGLDRAKKALATAQAANDAAQADLAKASKARGDAEADGGSQVQGSSAWKTWQKSIQVEEGAKQKAAKAQKVFETMQKDMQEREGDVRQMTCRVEAIQAKGGAGG